jgi:hypothetical protein
LLAGIALLRRLLKTGIEPALVLLATVPVSIMAMQSYGGEAMLRVYAFTLPFMALAVPIGFAPRAWPVRRVVAGGVLLGLLSALLGLGFYVARFGNERFEFMRDTEVQAMHWVYENAPAGSIIGVYDAVLPWSFQDVEAHRHLKFPDFVEAPGENITKAAALLRRNRAGGFIVLTTSQEAHGEENLGLRPGWITRLRKEMISSGNFQVVYHNADAWVLEVTPSEPPVEVVPPAEAMAPVTIPYAAVDALTPPYEVIRPVPPAQYRPPAPATPPAPLATDAPTTTSEVQP